MTGPDKFAEMDGDEAQRLGDALDALASGRDPGVDPRRDPELDALLQTATVLDHLFSRASETASFESFRRRSRLAVMHRAESMQTARRLATESRTSGDRAAAIAPPLSTPLAQPTQQLSASRPSPSGSPEAAAGLFSLTRLRRWLVPAFAPLTAAAAAAAVTFAALGGGEELRAPRSTGAASVLALHEVGVPSRPIAENLTPRTIDEQLVRLQLALGRIAGAAQRGESVSTDLLRQVTEDTASVQREIDRAPHSVSAQTVASYAQAASQGRAVLEDARAEPGGEGALSAAQLTADQAVVTAARYLAERGETATPEPTPVLPPPATATPVPSPTPTPTPEPSATATPSPAATVEGEGANVLVPEESPAPENPTGTPSASPTPTETPSPAPTVQ